MKPLTWYCRPSTRRLQRHRRSPRTPFLTQNHGDSEPSEGGFGGASLDISHWMYSMGTRAASDAVDFPGAAGVLERGRIADDSGDALMIRATLWLRWCVVGDITLDVFDGVVGVTWRTRTASDVVSFPGVVGVSEREDVVEVVADDAGDTDDQGYALVRIARIFNTYGPRMCIDDGRVVNNFVAQALRKEPLTVYGDGKQTRSFQYVSDLVVQETIDSNAKIEFRPNTEDDPHKRKPDISKAKELLGWEPVVSLRDGLPRMVSDFRQRIFGDEKGSGATGMSSA
ncbi:UDP-glucuronic acid decarboxylase 4 [Camellia lanceoleosa]|uniref:UDP-glucuronic acid decarboxylase 4 n=1 Tax=Camellia lanceoleosa TaxID=1840588 RepID=A0ACC0GTN7_9ERIC|nr:UDP-glucuronic acid decarboxylase 4 [Camellia lanceoleosa]